ncbi:MAG: CDP-alcohol phosphatidyltransferase family protein [Chloroflexi bacterium]|nr:CDP-alcohol phosphatidyltransferase family protein [Chloroflexota bacterium]
MDEVGRRFSERLTLPVARALGRTGITPNVLTILGLLLNVGAAYVIASGHLLWGGFFVLFCGGFDMLDGALARATGRTTRFGALLDSTLDRYSEALLFLGLLIFYLGRPLETVLISVCLVGSFMVSYVRARAEGLDIECKVGLTGRAERVLILAAGLIFGQILPALWILAVVANLTALQRLFHVWRETR